MDLCISIYQARYATSIVEKYLDTATVQYITNVYKTNVPSDMIFTIADASISDEQIKKLARELNLHYRACIGWFICLLSTIVDLSFAVHKLAIFSSNHGEVHFEVLVHLLWYIRDNKTLELKYYADLNDAPLFHLLRQAIIKTDNHLIDISDSSWHYFPNIFRSTGAYVIFYQGETMDNVTHVFGPVS